MWKAAVATTGEPHEAEDLVQDTLLRAYRFVDRFDGRHPRAWLLTILRNTNMNRHRPSLTASGELPEPSSGTLAADSAEDQATGDHLDARIEGGVAPPLPSSPTSPT